MTVEQFVVELTLLSVLAIALTIVGVIVLVSCLFIRIGPGRTHIGWVNRPLSEDMHKKIWAFFGIMFIVLGAAIMIISLPATVTINSGYVSVKSSPFLGVGNINITSSEIASAHIGQIGTENLTLTKQHGISEGNLRIGKFTLRYGQTAYIVSNNVTSLIIHLNNGQYVILGNSNTEALATSFSQNVHPLKTP